VIGRPRNALTGPSTTLTFAGRESRTHLVKETHACLGSLSSRYRHSSGFLLASAAWCHGGPPDPGVLGSSLEWGSPGRSGPRPDGGQLVPPPGQRDPRELKGGVADPLNGWAFGAAANHPPTTAKGVATWTAKASGVGSARSAWGLHRSPERAGAVGAGGHHPHTNDGGAHGTHTSRAGGVCAQFKGVRRCDLRPLKGWAASNNGQGSSAPRRRGNWSVDRTAAPPHARSASVATRSTGWAVGNNGTIATTSDGGPPGRVRRAQAVPLLRDVAFTGRFTVGPWAAPTRS